MRPLAALTESLRDDPPNRESWAVYADLLMEGGDPFGDIVRRALDGHSSVRVLAAARAARDSAYWPEALLSWPYTPSLVWRMGLWDELELVLDSLDEGDDDLIEAIQEIGAHPAARLLRCLRLRFDPQMDWDNHLYHLDALAAVELPLSLDLDGARVAELGVLARIPRLQALKIWSYPPSEPLEHLHSLTLIAPFHGQLDPLPALRKLSLRLEEGASLSLRALSSAPLASLSLTWLERPPTLDPDALASLPSLAHLGLLGPLPGARAVFEPLSGSGSLRSLALGDSRALAHIPPALAASLQTLSLHYFSDDALRALPRFQELETLRLLGCLPRREVLAELPRLATLHLSYPRTLPDLAGLSLDRLLIDRNAIPAALVDTLLAMGSLRELSLEGSLERETLDQLHRLRALPGLSVLDVSRCHGVPEPLRWRFEGDELPWALSALSER